MTTCVDVVCEEGCDVALPAPKFNICSPEGALGQIREIYQTNVNYPLTDENNVNEWLGRMAMPDSNPAKIHRILVIGDMPASEDAEIQMSYGRTFYGTDNRSINLRIDEVNDENYAYANAFSCNKRVKIWPVMSGGDALGGPGGIDVSMKWKHVVPESDGELQTFTAVAKWKSKTMPCRFMHPLAGDDIGLES